MPKYIVTRRYICLDKCEIEADSGDDAKKKAAQRPQAFTTVIVRDFGYAVRKKPNVSVNA